MMKMKSKIENTTPCSVCGECHTDYRCSKVNIQLPSSKHENFNVFHSEKLRMEHLQKLCASTRCERSFSDIPFETVFIIQP